MSVIPHIKRTPWVDEPVLLSLLVDEILPVDKFRNRSFTRSDQNSVCTHTETGIIENSLPDGFVQGLIVFFLTVGLDLDKGRLIPDHWCNYLDDEIDVARQR